MRPVDQGQGFLGAGTDQCGATRWSPAGDAGTEANYLYLTATLDAATWGAQLAAVGEGADRIYRVEPTGPFEDDPNLTDKWLPGNPTRSTAPGSHCEKLPRSWTGRATSLRCSRT